MVRPVVPMLHARSQRRSSRGRHDRRHLIAFLEPLEERIVLNHKLADLAATGASLLKRSQEAHDDGQRRLAALDAKRAAHMLNIVADRSEAQTAEAHDHAAAGGREHEPPRAAATDQHRRRPHATAAKHAPRTEKPDANLQHRRRPKPAQPSPTGGGIAPDTSGGDPPVANNDAYTVYHDQALIANTAQNSVLANDTDADGYTLTAVQETNVQHGTLTLNSEI